MTGVVAVRLKRRARWLRNFGSNFGKEVPKFRSSASGAGDLLVVKSIDRFGRDYDDTINEWRHVTKGIGADIIVLDMPLLDMRGRQDGLTGAADLRFRAPAPQLRRAGRARVHPAAPGRGNSQRQGARREVRAARQKEAEELAPHLRTTGLGTSLGGSPRRDWVCAWRLSTGGWPRMGGIRRFRPSIGVWCTYGNVVAICM